MGQTAINPLQQLNLFEVAPTLPPPPKKGERCKNCKHLTRNNWNSNLKYCTKQRGRTKHQRYKKIKANDAACMFFEPIENAKLFIEK